MGNLGRISKASCNKQHRLISVKQHNVILGLINASTMYTQKLPRLSLSSFAI